MIFTTSGGRQVHARTSNEGDKQPQSCHVDLLTVMFAKFIVAHCSVVRGERRGRDESAAGATCRQKVGEGRVGAGDYGCLFR
jgi:hypothetical protein